ncbi:MULTISPECIES: YkyA family protein [Carnobacterium]|uniref:YkyA family protein n=2 Tax=Carnobacterium maltaromaticum TaxID=2751 RepID=A0AAW9JNS2_CARML|nr:MULTISPECIES: YkyA family protein [Carnobacterium]KRN62941.1 hypothetical protein IV70_GL003276 [Carnobacterium maltaromaticum DSM 20342]KRN85002.1 hypothetical protein IV75_GL003150 [Carnobacterium maltaromaticum]MDZ5757238.1 YkyA family protein [Carnobacterium maltaromaticum]
MFYLNFKLLNKKVYFVLLPLLFLVLASCGNTEERAGAKKIAEENNERIENINTHLEKYEALEEDMMTALSNDLKDKNAEKIIRKKTGEVGENFKARKKELASIQKNMTKLKENQDTLLDYQAKKAVDMPETELENAIQTLKQLSITYDLFYSYYEKTVDAESEFYQNFSSDMKKEELAEAISLINISHGAAFQQLEVLSADLSSTAFAMTNLADAIKEKDKKTQ